MIFSYMSNTNTVTATEITATRSRRVYPCYYGTSKAPRCWPLAVVGQVAQKHVHVKIPAWEVRREIVDNAQNRPKES